MKVSSTKCGDAPAKRNIVIALTASNRARAAVIINNLCQYFFLFLNAVIRHIVRIMAISNRLELCFGLVCLNDCFGLIVLKKSVLGQIRKRFSRRATEY